MRETFAISHLSVGHEVEYGKQHGDFVVDGRYTFEVEGAGKNFKQIADIPNSFILADDMDYPLGNKLPLWLIGFLYKSLLLQFGGSSWLFDIKKRSPEGLLLIG